MDDDLNNEIKEINNKLGSIHLKLMDENLNLRSKVFRLEDEIQCLISDKNWNTAFIAILTAISCFAMGLSF